MSHRYPPALCANIAAGKSTIPSAAAQSPAFDDQGVKGGQVDVCEELTKLGAAETRSHLDDSFVVVLLTLANECRGWAVMVGKREGNLIDWEESTCVLVVVSFRAFEFTVSSA